MDRREALAILKLQEPASPSEIDAARQSAMKVVHPDGSKPDEEQARLVNEAHRVASSNTPTHEVVPAAAMLEIVERNSAALEQVARSDDTTRAVSQIASHHVGRLAHARRQRLAMGGLTALFGALVALLQTAPAIAPNERAAGILSFGGSGLFIAGAFLAIYAALSKNLEERLQLQIEEVAETLSDRGALQMTFEEVGIASIWTRDELRQRVERWIHHGPHGSRSAFDEPLVLVAERIGDVDFTRILLAKGLERGVVEEMSDSTHGSPRYGYRLVRG